MLRHLGILALTLSLAWVVGGCTSNPDPAAPVNAAGASLAGNASAAAAGTYDFVPLDVPASLGSFASAYGINNQGQVVGNFVALDGTVHGFLFAKGAFTDVVVPDAGFWQASLNDINEGGVAVGFYSDIDEVGHSFLRAADGAITKLDDPQPGALSSEGSGINNIGTIVGNFFDADGAVHGFILPNNGAYEIYDYPGALRTRLNDVNNHGDIAGTWTDFARHAHGVVLTGGLAQPVDVPGAVSTRLSRINDRGMVVGFYNNADGVFHGFLYQKGEFTTVDFPDAADTAATGINDRGVIVGTYDDFSRAFIAMPRSKDSSNFDSAGH